ncbi:MAG: VWA domain-containing protein [Planctomycetota bacterium]|nr:MAG: VWA domain-containing protein [Planctomycetota bacterium]
MAFGLQPSLLALAEKKLVILVRNFPVLFSFWLALSSGLAAHGGAYTGPGEPVPPASGGIAATGPLPPPSPPQPEVIASLSDYGEQAESRRRALAQMAALGESLSLAQLRKVRDVLRQQDLVDYTRCLTLCGPEALDDLQLQFRRSHPLVKAEAVYGLVTLDQKGGEKFAREVLRNPKLPPSCHAAALRALSDRGSLLAKAEALRQLQVGDKAPLFEALSLVAESAGQEHILHLIGLMERSSGRAGKEAHALLQSITGWRMGLDPMLWKQQWRRHQARGEEFTQKETAAQDPEQVTLSYMGVPIYGDHLVFLLDLSGSMTGALASSQRLRGEAALKELEWVLRNLPKGASFDVVAFNQQAASFAGKKLRPCNEANIQEVMGWIRQRNFQGGTDLFHILQQVFHKPGVEEVLLLTDGVPSSGLIQEPARLLAFVRHWNRWRNIRFNTVSMAAPGDAGQFLQQLAQEHQGLCKVIQ